MQTTQDSQREEQAGKPFGGSACSRYLEWLETAAERETKKAVAKKQDGELVASAFAEGVAVGLRLAATEFENGGIASANAVITDGSERSGETFGG